MVDRLRDGRGWASMIELADRSLAERGSRLTMSLAWIAGRLAIDLASRTGDDPLSILDALVRDAVPDDE
jgi:hypothetical protein